MASVLVSPAYRPEHSAFPTTSTLKVEASRVPRGPCIPLVTGDDPRPLFSVMIPTYNSIRFLRKTLRSVLDQDLGRDVMEIVVVDNCSTRDDPEPIVREVAGDRVEVRRQNRNIGAVANFNSCVAHARGHWIHILHSDDFVRPGFYEGARSALSAEPGIGAYITRHIYADDDGEWVGLSERLGQEAAVGGEELVLRQLVSQQIQFVTTIVRRSVYEELGGFRSFFDHCPDWDMWNRVILTHPVFYDPALFGCCRLHGDSATTDMIATGKNVRDERRCLWTYSALLPRPYARQVFRAGMSNAGIRALRNAWRNWRAGKDAAALRQFGQALRCWISAGASGLAYRRLPSAMGWTAHQGT